MKGVVTVDDWQWASESLCHTNRMPVWQVQVSISQRNAQLAPRSASGPHLLSAETWSMLLFALAYHHNHWWKPFFLTSSLFIFKNGEGSFLVDDGSNFQPPKKRREWKKKKSPQERRKSCLRAALNICLRNAEASSGSRAVYQDPSQEPILVICFFLLVNFNSETQARVVAFSIRFPLYVACWETFHTLCQNTWQGLHSTVKDPELDWTVAGPCPIGCFCTSPSLPQPWWQR